MERTNEGIGQSCPAFKATSQINPNTEIRINDRVWQVHAAPGHDMEAILLFAPLEKILISGDAFWENGFGVVFPELSQEEGFKHVRDTLSLIGDLDPNLVVPGHGRMFTQVKDSLNLAYQKLDYFESNPVSHAKYASNVFVKFKLMQENFIVVSLYVDDKKILPAEKRTTYITKEKSEKDIEKVGDLWSTFETENFSSNAQPLYALLTTDELLLNKPVGYTPEAKEYLKWLECGLQTFRNKK
jgi:hypothetical protein